MNCSLPASSVLGIFPGKNTGVGGLPIPSPGDLPDPGIESVSPDSSVGKEPACNAGDPGSIPGLGRSAGAEIGYPLQYSPVF